MRISDWSSDVFSSDLACGNCAQDRPAYCDASTNLNMRGGRRDETSALRLGGVPITGGFFGQSSFATHAIAGSRTAVPLPGGFHPALAPPLASSVQTRVGAGIGRGSRRARVWRYGVNPVVALISK